MNKENKNVIVIGIGGISRAGKSSLTRFLIDYLKPVDVFPMDKYLIAPIRKFDTKINEYVEDWEDSNAFQFDKFYENLKYKIDYFNNEKFNDRIYYILVEGFLLYSKQEFVDLLDIKIRLDVDKEIARNRRILTKNYPGDYYYDEYIWKVYNETNVYFNLDDKKSFIVDANEDMGIVQMKALEKLKEFFI